MKTVTHKLIGVIGATEYGNIMIMPAVGDPESMIDEKNYRSKQDKKKEKADKKSREKVFL